MEDYDIHCANYIFLSIINTAKYIIKKYNVRCDDTDKILLTNIYTNLSFDTKYNKKFHIFYDIHTKKRMIIGKSHNFGKKYQKLKSFLHIKNIEKNICNKDFIDFLYIYICYSKQTIIKMYQQIKHSDILFVRLCEYINKMIFFVTEYQQEKKINKCNKSKYSIYNGYISKCCHISIVSSVIFCGTKGLFYLKIIPRFDDVNGCIYNWKICEINNSPWKCNVICINIGFPMH